MLLFGKISSTAGNLKMLELLALYLFLLWVHHVSSLRQLFVTFDSTTVNRFNFFGFFLGEFLTPTPLDVYSIPN